MRDAIGTRTANKAAWLVGAALLVCRVVLAAQQVVVVDPTSDVWYTLVVAAGDKVHCGNETRVEGNIHGNRDVELHPHSTLVGDVSATGKVKAQGSVTGAIRSGAPERTLPAIPSEAELRALANRVFEGDTTLPSSHIDDVVFVRGRLRVQGDLQGSGTLIATGDIEIEDVGSKETSQLEPDTRLSLIAGGGVRLGKERKVRAVVRARGDVELRNDVVMEGVVVANGRVTAHNGAVLRFFDFDQTAPIFTSLMPPRDAYVGQLRPAIGASIGDDLSGVDPATLRLVLDGTDRTGQSVVDATGIRYTPPADLAPGRHEVALSARDRSANEAEVSWQFLVDVTPPVMGFTAPTGTLVTEEPRVEIKLAFQDAGSGIDPSSLRLQIDQVTIGGPCEITADEARCSSPELAPGFHEVGASVSDHAGNVSAATTSFELVVDRDPPTVALVAPADGEVTKDSQVEVRGTVSDDSQVTRVEVNGLPATLAGTAYSASVELRDGANSLLVVATDRAGRQGFATATVTLDRDPPDLEVEQPRDGQLANGDQVRVNGRADDRHGPVKVTVNGAETPLTDGTFAADLPLNEGPNAIAVVAFDEPGNFRELSLSVTRYSLPDVRITSPADLSYHAATTVAVSGTVDPSAREVSVNGVPATIAGTTFGASSVPLIEGGNIVTATAVDERGHVGTDTIQVVRDTTPPRISIYSPPDGATVFEPAVTVRGLINDIVPGTVNASEVQVTVNGRPAVVANRSFLATGVVLAAGDNVIAVSAVDENGNRAESSARVKLEPVPTRRILALSGDGQFGRINQPLADPLAVELRGDDGQPAAGRPVVFRVRMGDGHFAGERGVAVTTDSAGRASTSFALGSRMGAGNHVVEASSVGFGSPAAFIFSALPADPALIVVDSGALQVGVAGRELPRPLVAAVVDAGSNRLPAVPVVFTAVKGGGRFANGASEVVVTTDSDGRAITSFVLGPGDGISNNVVQAAIQGVEAVQPVGFIASGWAAGEATATAVAGVVLDNSNVPVQGVTVRIKDTALTAVTDAEGRFRISPAPIGDVKLIVDGSTAARSGAWPDLEFDLITISGRENTLGMPIYLLPLDLQSGIYVDETRGGTLRLPDFPGFALDVAAGSVTFPSGGRSGLVTATVVHTDKVPMVPNFGQQPRFIVTIQPAGARFDPPARLTLPNLDSLGPGRITEMYSFDHDLGHFVSIGPATVSEDGTVIASSSGVGIVKAGWHCGGDPAPVGTPHHCIDCYQCINNTCVAEKLCKACITAPGKACDGKGHCRTGQELLQTPSVCEDLSIKAEDQGLGDCSAVPDLEGIPDLCGAALRVTYREVTHDCDGMDLVGAELNEEITSDGLCGGEGPIKLGSCAVVQGNMLAPAGKVCRDYFWVCRPVDLWPMNSHCTETWTQKIYINDCLAETRKLVFTIVRDAQGCDGFADRQ